MSASGLDDELTTANLAENWMRYIFKFVPDTIQDGEGHDVHDFTILYRHVRNEVVSDLDERLFPRPGPRAGRRVRVAVRRPSRRLRRAAAGRSCRPHR